MPFQNSNGCGQIKFYCGLCGLRMDVGVPWPKQSEYYMAMAVGRLCEGTVIFITRGSSLRRIGQFHKCFSAISDQLKVKCGQQTRCDAPDFFPYWCRTSFKIGLDQACANRILQVHPQSPNQRF